MPLVIPQRSIHLKSDKAVRAFMQCESRKLRGGTAGNRGRSKEKPCRQANCPEGMTHEKHRTFVWATWNVSQESVGLVFLL